jgi:hypothetical protein
MASNSIRKTILGSIVGVFFAFQANAQPYQPNAQLYPSQFYCEPCEACECPSRFWGSAEYLYWKIQDSPKIIPLIATAPFIPINGPALTQPGAKVVLGGRHIDNDWRSGGRFTIGYNFDNPYCLSAEASYFFLPQDSRKHKVFSSGAPGSPFLAVPYFDTLTESESSSPVAVPGMFQGLARLRVSNWMQGAELNGWASVYSNCNYKIGAMIGFRYWNFNENLKFLVNSPQVGVSNIYQVRDHFDTENNFYAGQIGLRIDGECRNFFYNLKGKVALGGVREELRIKGRFTTNNFDGFGAPQTFPGGYFALPSNIGRHKRTRFAVMPEVDFNLGYHITNCLDFCVGYTFLYINEVLWAGKQLKRNINPTQSSLYEFTPTPTLMGKPSPKASFKQDSLWVQGINVGLEYRF